MTNETEPKWANVTIIYARPASKQPSAQRFVMSEAVAQQLDGDWKQFQSDRSLSAREYHFADRFDEFNFAQREPGSRTVDFNRVKTIQFVWRDCYEPPTGYLDFPASRT